MDVGQYHLKWDVVVLLDAQGVLLNVVHQTVALVDQKDFSDSAVDQLLAVKLVDLRDVVDVEVLVNAVLLKLGLIAVIHADRMDAVHKGAAVVICLDKVTVAQSADWDVRIAVLAVVLIYLDAAIGISL